MKRFKQRPSPAMIVAMAALIVSIGGTAVAGPIAEISLNKGEKRQIRKISRNISGKVSNRRITKRAPGLSVAAARNAGIANIANLAALANTVKDDAITSESIKDAGVTTEDLEDAAVTLAKLAADSVDSSKVIDNSLSSLDLGPNSVTSSEIATNAVGASEVASNSIDGDEIVNGQVKADDLGALVTAQNVDSIPANTSGTATVACPAGTQVISGGGFTGSFIDMDLVTSIRSGNGWQIQARNETGGALDLTVRAYCLEQ